MVKMESCEVKFTEIIKTVSTQNVTKNALVTLFGLDETCSLWLKESGLSTIIFHDAEGNFPTLEAYSMYSIEIGPAQERNAGKGKERALNDADDDSTDSDVDFRCAAYKLVTASKKSAKKYKGSKGKRPVPSPRTPAEGK